MNGLISYTIKDIWNKMTQSTIGYPSLYINKWVSETFENFTKLIEN